MHIRHSKTVGPHGACKSILLMKCPSSLEKEVWQTIFVVGERYKPGWRQAQGKAGIQGTQTSVGLGNSSKASQRRGF